jgi:hypothetical protein
MKMRHHAIPGDVKDKPSSVLVDQRLHVKVKLDDPRHAGKEGMFWFRKVKKLFRRWKEIEPNLPIDCGDWEGLRPSCQPSRNTFLGFICAFI